MPFWGFAWPGGWGISRYLLDNPEVVKDRTVVDFACGSGVQSIAAVLAGASRAEAVDIDRWAVSATEMNAELNGVADQIIVSDANIVGHEVDADVLVAGDVCYEEPLASEVYRWLGHVAATGTTVLLGDPGRWALPRRSDTTRLTHNSGPDVDQAYMQEVASYDLPRALQDDNIGFQRTHVWRVRGGMRGG